MTTPSKHAVEAVKECHASSFWNSDTANAAAVIQKYIDADPVSRKSGRG